MPGEDLHLSGWVRLKAHRRAAAGGRTRNARAKTSRSPIQAVCFCPRVLCASACFARRTVEHLREPRELRGYRRVVFVVSVVAL